MKRTMLVLATLTFTISCSSTSVERRPASVTPERWMVHSHRGASHLPENMMSAFHCATKMGADYIEMDLQITKDDYVVVAHDAYVKQECNDEKGAAVAPKSVFFRQTNWKNKLENFDCGTRTVGSVQAVPGEKISRLLEVLTELKDVRNSRNAPIKFNIEIKYSNNRDHYPSRSHFASKIMEVLKKSEVGEHRLLVQSFDVEILKEMRKRSPSLRLAILVGDEHALEHAMDNLDELNTDLITPHYSFVSKEMVDAFHARNARVVPWTVNSLETKQLMHDAGVDGVITDNLQMFYPESATACQ